MFHVQQTETWTSRIFLPPGPVTVGGEAPELYLALLGRFESTGRFVYQQVSPGYSVHVVEAGEGQMATGGESTTVGAGDVYTFFPQTHYQYHDHLRSPWRYTWLALAGRRAEEVLALAGITPAQPLLRGAPLKALEALFQEIIATYRQADPSPLASVAFGWRLVELLAGTNPASAPPCSTTLAEQARFLMDQHFMEPLTVQDIARHLRVSRVTLFRQFRATYGVAPKPYLDGVRIEQAKQLLLQSRSSIKEIAVATGFGSVAFFSRAFKAHCNVAPSRWLQTGSTAVDSSTGN